MRPDALLFLLSLLCCKAGNSLDTDSLADDTSCVPDVEVPYDGLDQDCDGADLDDLDGDGFDHADDCDDANAAVYPGADDIPYDGIDQDCDGADLDDLDGDGFGHTEDCDDTNSALYPGAVETCDSVDQDCDGQIDEEAVDTRSGYLDADNDGFGDPNSPWSGCETLGPEDGSDCDDTNPSVSPAAGELCDDLVDNDCDGYIDQMVAGWTHTTVQEAIDGACQDGDTVWVAPDIYYETLVINRTLTVQAIEDANTTVVDASMCVEADCPVVSVNADFVTLRGLTITGGHRIGESGYDGGGIYAYAIEELLVDACRVTANTAYWGGGIGLAWSSARIMDSEIAFNGNRFAYGAGILIRGSHDFVMLDGNHIHSNTGRFGGGITLYSGPVGVFLIGNMIEGNQAEYGGGIYDDGAADVVSVTNTVTGNAALATSGLCVGGGIYGQGSWESFGDTISGNSPDDICP